MGRKEGLHVNVPIYFRCPISLDVMKSPVSLCTGVTYDRSSIQKWLDQGNNTCPATMQLLPTTDLVPNHTLHRLIQLWSHRPRSATDDEDNKPSTPTHHVRPPELLRDIQASRDPLPLLNKLADVARDPDTVDELVDRADCIPTLNGLLIREGDQGLDVLQAAIGVLAIVLARKDGGSAAPVKAMATTRTIASLLLVLKDGTSLNSRTDAAKVLESIASLDTESKLLVAETDGVLPELARLVTDESADPDAIEAGLSCLIAVSGARRARPPIVRTGIVPAIGRILSRPETTGSIAEKAMKLLEAASTCKEGRVAICEDAGTVVTGVVGRMMKVSKAATEHAVLVLWSVCHLFRDRRAQEALAASNGLTKMLLLMQSNCSPAARGMAGDLLKIFSVNSKSCLGSYDTKTTHIMPF